MNPLLLGLSTLTLFPYALISQGGYDVRWMYTAPVPFYINASGAPYSAAGDDTREAFLTWNQVSSSNFQWTYSGSTGSYGFTEDGVSAVSYDDPYNQLPSGVLAATVPWGSSSTHSYNGRTFRTLTEMDMVFNDGISFASNDDILFSCSSAFSIHAVTLHEAGHAFGLDHPNVAYDKAVMYASIAPCDGTKANPKLDDIQGITYLYDSSQPIVYPSFTVNKSKIYLGDELIITDSSAGVTSWLWNFGDGTTSTDPSPKHTYSAVGSYSVTLRVNGTIDGPASPVSVFEKPVIDFSGSKTSGASPVKVTFKNLSTGTVAGYRWDFGDNTGSTEVSPEHTYLYNGKYTVKLIGAGEAGNVENIKENYITVGSGGGGGGEGGGEEGRNGFEDFFYDLGCQCAVAAPQTHPRFPLSGMIALSALAGAILLRRRRR